MLLMMDACKWRLPEKYWPWSSQKPQQGACTTECDYSIGEMISWVLLILKFYRTIWVPMLSTSGNKHCMHLLNSQHNTCLDLKST